MDKLRLLMSPVCNRNCEKCCNKVFDLASLPLATDFTGYHAISLTGGEPMLDPLKVIKAVRIIRKVNPTVKIYLYTAKADCAHPLLCIMKLIDGITLTLHDQKDVQECRCFMELVQNGHCSGKSMKLCVFEGIDYRLRLPLANWTVTELKWLEPEDCPLPDGEEFMRYD